MSKLIDTQDPGVGLEIFEENYYLDMPFTLRAYDEDAEVHICVDRSGVLTLIERLKAYIASN